MTIGILGGGLAGLSAGYYLKREGTAVDRPVRIVEANGHTGGWIQSWRDGETDVVSELGPRTIRGRGKSARNTYGLIKDLGIEGLVRDVGGDASSRYIYARGNTHRLPMSVWKALFAVNAPFTRPWIYYALRECFSSSKHAASVPEATDDDESAYDFFCRTYGQEFADYLISPLLCGVSGGNAKQMSVKFMFGALYEAERKHGSVGLGMLKEALWNRKKPEKSEEDAGGKPPPSVYYLNGGLQRLVRALQIVNESRGVHVDLNTRCAGLRFPENCGGRAEVTFSDGQQLECSHVVSALPAHKLASLFCDAHPHSALVQLLNSIPMASIVTVDLSYDDPKVMGPYRGFGVLTPPQEKLSLLGVIFNNCIYGRNDRVDLTVMMGGYGFEKHFVRDSKCLPKEELTNIAMDHVKRVLNIQSAPNSHCTRILQDCIPQYTVGHYERVAKIQDYIISKRLPLSIVGSSYAGISINDVIYASMVAMRKLCR